MSDKKKDYIEARKRVRSGEDKDILYKQYKDSLGEKGVATLLSVYPDKYLRDKYSSLTNILLGSLVLVTILKLFVISEMLEADISLEVVLIAGAVGLGINIAAIYCIYIKHVFAFRLVALFCLQAIPKVLDFEVISTYSSFWDWAWLSTSCACLVVGAGLGLFIPKRMFPYHGWFKSKEIVNGVPIYTTSQMSKNSPNN